MPQFLPNKLKEPQSLYSPPSTKVPANDVEVLLLSTIIFIF